ncbi:MAG: DUF5662 family protein [Methylococcaceae bacterium]
MTSEELSFENETRKHQELVKGFLWTIIKFLGNRAAYHDISKMNPPEREIFIIYTAKLKGLTYGSQEYKDCLAAMKPALEHHYKVNWHHPENRENGINGMNLVDIMEMFCDWMAAVKRHDDGDIMKSIEINEKRFNISPQLSQIFINTVRMFEIPDK